MNNQITFLSNTLLKQGYRLTVSRRAIMAALVATNGHVSADGLVEIVHETAPGVGRMTVYRTLDLLTDLGLIRPVYQGTGAAHYILMTDGRHHHLICVMCSKVIEFDRYNLTDVEKSIGEKFSFELHGHLFEIYGVCRDCRQ